MTWPVRRTVGVLIAVGVSLLAALAVMGVPALAQYPAPVGSVSAAVDTSTPPITSSVSVTCTVLDTAGNPIADEPCTFAIVSQLGSGASFQGEAEVTVLTDDQGVAVATLDTGSVSGTVVVRVEARGVASQATLSVQPTQTPTPTPAPTATPVPAATATPGAAPSTGVGTDGGGGFTWWPLALVGAALVVIGGVLALRRVRA
ncbi:MAG: hypothetical protein ACE5IZ_04405 [Dehalococcoidia bacterium]